MDNKTKLRMAALKRLSKRKNNPEEYMEGLKEMKRDKAKALLHRSKSPASADKDAKFEKKMFEAGERMDELTNEGKSEEDLEREAYNRLYKDRLKKGMLTKPFKSFKK
jgi:hypothetical protein